MPSFVLLNQNTTFTFKVTILIRLGHKLCVTISLVFAFKVTIFIRLGHKLCVK